MSTIRRVHSSGSLGEHAIPSTPALPKKAPSRSRSNPFRRSPHKRSASAQVPGETQRSSRTPSAPRHAPTGSLPVVMPPPTPRGASAQRNVSLGARSEPASPARVTSIGRDASQRPNAPTPPELPEETAAGLELADSPPPFGLLPAFSLSPQGEFAESVHRPINELQQSRVIRMRTRANSGAVDPPRTIPARLFVQPPPPVPPVPPPSPPRAQRIATALRRRPSVRNEPIRKGETLLAGALQDSRSLRTAADASAAVSPDKSQDVTPADERPRRVAEAKGTGEPTQSQPEGCAELQETGTRTDERFSAVVREWQSAFGAFVTENTTETSESTASAAGAASAAATEPHPAPAAAPEQPTFRNSPTSAGPPTGAEPPTTGALTEASSTTETPISASMYTRSGHGDRDAAAEPSMPPLVTPPPPFTPFPMSAQRAQASVELRSSPMSPPPPHAPPTWLSPAPEEEAEAATHTAMPRTPRRKKSKMGLFLKETLFPRQARSDMPLTARAAEAEQNASSAGQEPRRPPLERRASTLSLCSTLSGSPQRMSTHMSDSPTLGGFRTHSVVDALNPRSFSTSDYVSNVPVPAPVSPAPAGPTSNTHEAPQVPVSAGGELGTAQPPRRAVRGLGRRIASSLSLASMTRGDAAHRPETALRPATAPRRTEEGSAPNSAMPAPPVHTPPTHMTQSPEQYSAATPPSLPRSEQPRGASQAAETRVRPPGSHSESEQSTGSSPRARRWGIPFALPSRIRSADIPRMRARAASDTVGSRRNSRMP